MSVSPAALHAANESWAVGPIEAPAVLRASGKDAKDYLHRMTTQDVNALPPGGSAYTAILNAKGHLLADAHVLVETDGVLLVMDPRAAPDARAHLEKFVIMDDVAFEDLSAEVRVVPDLAAEELEVLRILAGQARFGADMDASRLPMEAGLTRLAISFTKGCYTGQEVVLRATARGHLQRGLVQLALPPGAVPGTILSAGGQDVGVVTSAAETPEGRIGLGYVRRAQWKEGERVATAAGEAIVRKVIAEDGIARPGC